MKSTSRVTESTNAQQWLEAVSIPQMVVLQQCIKRQFAKGQLI
jgi:hypothetical protein